jgi:hypothetical protein
MSSTISGIGGQGFPVSGWVAGSGSRPGPTPSPAPQIGHPHGEGPSGARHDGGEKAGPPPRRPAGSPPAFAGPPGRGGREDIGGRASSPPFVIAALVRATHFSPEVRSSRRCCRMALQVRGCRDGRIAAKCRSVDCHQNGLDRQKPPAYIALEHLGSLGNQGPEPYLSNQEADPRGAGVREVP